MYSTKTKTTKDVCEKLGHCFNIGFIETMVKNKKIYVSFSSGKPDEIRHLAKSAEDAGFSLSKKLEKYIKN